MVPQKRNEISSYLCEQVAAVLSGMQTGKGEQWGKGVYNTWRQDLDFPEVARERDHGDISQIFTELIAQFTFWYERALKNSISRRLTDLHAFTVL